MIIIIINNASSCHKWPLNAQNLARKYNSLWLKKKWIEKLLERLFLGLYEKFHFFVTAQYRWRTIKSDRDRLIEVTTK